MQYVLINNEYVTEDNAKISIKDRAFRFGDGIFETIKIQKSELKDYNLHYQRLSEGLDAIKINFDISALEKKALLLVKKNKITDGLLRVMITRGEGSMGYLPKKNILPNLVIEAFKLPNMVNKQYKLLVSNYQKISSNSLPVHCKLMQGLNSTLAKISAYENNYDDALMLNDKKEICETSSANIFFIKKGKVYTPSQDSSILKGVVREKIINSFPIIEKKINIKKIKKYDLIFITNIALPIRFVKEIYNEKQNLIWNSTEVGKSFEIFAEIKKLLS
ncbi:MAG: aminotransferase class IV family protein [Rickettsiales bacterium]|nr:aminotransferase class IV family protein [Rickettsiales bacterium]